MTGREPNSCVLVHVTGLLFWLNLKMFLLSIFISLDFWSSMFCIVLDFEPADKIYIEDSGVLVEGNVHRYSLCPPRKVRTNKTSNFVYENIARNCVEQWLFGLQWASRHSSQRCTGRTVCKTNKKLKILGNSMDKNVENMDDHGCPKIRKFVDPEAFWEMWVSSSYPFRHRTTFHCTERKPKLLCQWTMQHLNL